MNTTIKKHIGFPKDLFQMLEINARTFGVTVPEYIRYLVVNDAKAMITQGQHFQKWESELPLKSLTEEEQKSLTKGIQEHEEMQQKGKENIMSADEIMKNIS